MNHFRVIIDYFGDLGAIEMALYDLIASVPTTKFDSVDIEIINEGMSEDA